MGVAEARILVIEDDRDSAESYAWLLKLSGHRVRVARDGEQGMQLATDEPPDVRFNNLEPGVIDDSVVAAVLSRARLQGYDAYVMPQSPDLPMANRREDILIIRP